MLIFLILKGDCIPFNDTFFSNYWLSAILIDPAKTEELQEIVRLKLDKSNIESRPLWKPMHLQPVFLNILIMVILLPRHFY
jgi:hypothetical protein